MLVIPLGSIGLALFALVSGLRKLPYLYRQHRTLSDAYAHGKYWFVRARVLTAVVVLAFYGAMLWRLLSDATPRPQTEIEAMEGGVGPDEMLKLCVLFITVLVLAWVLPRLSLLSYVLKEQYLPKHPFQERSLCQAWVDFPKELERCFKEKNRRPADPNVSSRFST